MQAPQQARTSGCRTAWHILGAVVLALAFAFALPYVGPRIGLTSQSMANVLGAVGLGGTLFLRLLKMIVVPLVIFSVMSGVLGVGDVRRLGRPGAYSLLYFLSTSVLAATVGLVVANLVRPGAGPISLEPSVAADAVVPSSAIGDASAGASAVPQGPTTLAEAFGQLLLGICTDNLFRAMAEGNLLPLIVFSIVFASVLTTLGPGAKTVCELITATSEALLKFVMLLMRVAPLGIFCLVAAQFGQAVAQGEFAETFFGLSAYILVVLGGLAVHALVTLPLILYLSTRRNPYRFLARMSDALLTAFSTASSSATLPVSMECAERRAGVSRRSVQFVLPLGSTVNMDGTALYQASAAVFVSEVCGMPLGPLEQVTIVAAATLASIGTAGVPQSGLIALLVVLHAVGLPEAGIALLLSVDWLLDRLRTTVNVLGDAVGAAVVARTFGP